METAGVGCGLVRFLEGAIFFSVPHRLNRKPNLPSDGVRRLKRSQHQVDPTRTCGSDVNNAWSRTSTPAYVFLARCLTEHRHKCTKRYNVRVWTGLSWPVNGFFISTCEAHSSMIPAFVMRLSSFLWQSWRHSSLTPSLKRQTYGDIMMRVVWARHSQLVCTGCVSTFKNLHSTIPLTSSFGLFGTRIRPGIMERLLIVGFSRWLIGSSQGETDWWVRKNDNDSH